MASCSYRLNRRGSPKNGERPEVGDLGILGELNGQGFLFDGGQGFLFDGGQGFLFDGNLSS